MVTFSRNLHFGTVVKEYGGLYLAAPIGITVGGNINYGELQKAVSHLRV